MSKRRLRYKRIRRRSFLEQLEKRLPLAGEFGHNTALPEDVNDDRTVSAIDALIIINNMANQQAESAVPDAESVDASIRSTYLDVTNDGKVSALDALRVINYLTAEGESPTDPSDGGGSELEDYLSFDSIFGEYNE